jgi:hypothetical protein
LNDVNGDYQVKWVPGALSKDRPHVVASGEEGRWLPEDGYMWGPDDWPNLARDRKPNASRAVEDHEVADALHAASEVVELHEQLDRLRDFSGLTQYDRVQTVLQILARRWVVDMPLAADSGQREILIKWARKELNDALTNALWTSVGLMLSDIKKLQPFEWNPLASQRREVIRILEDDIGDLQARATWDELDRDRTFTTIRSGSQLSALQYNPGPSLEQLLEINRRRRWAD